MSQAFAPLANDRLLRALTRQPVDYTPVWIMLADICPSIEPLAPALARF
jgi:uroporphyrinogen-III decarboxylase